MNITEFAIGNYVLLNGQPERVQGIQEDQFEPGRNVLLLGQGKVPLWYTLKEIQSIRLTPSILSICGFTFDRNVKPGTLYIGYGYTVYLDFDYTTTDIGGNSIRINTIHELVNMFRLFGEGTEIHIEYDKLKAAI